MISRKLRNIIAVLTPKERKRSAILMILDIIVSVADILFLTLLLYVVRLYSGGGGPGIKDMQGLLPIVGFFFLFALKNGAGFLVYRAQCRWLYGVASRISERKLLQYLEGDWDGYADTDPSVQMRSISYQPLEFCQHVLGGIQQIITQVVLISLTISAILIYNGKLFLLLLVVLLPPVVGVFYLVKARSAATGRKARASSERALQYLQEALSGFVESNVYGRNRIFLDRYTKEQDDFNQRIASHSIIQGIPSRMVEVFALMGIVILILINRWMGNADRDNLMTIGVFMAAAYKIIPGIVKVLTLSSQVNAYSFTLEGLSGPSKSSGGIKGHESRLPGEVVGLDVAGTDVAGSDVVGGDVVGGDVAEGDVVGRGVAGSGVAGSGVAGSGVAGSGVDGIGIVGPDVVGGDVVGSDVVGSDVVGSGVVGSDVVGSGVVGGDVVGGDVVGRGVAGSGVVGAGIVGSGIVGLDVVGTGIVGSNVIGPHVIGPEVVGSGVISPEEAKAPIESLK